MVSGVGNRVSEMCVALGGVDVVGVRSLFRGCLNPGFWSPGRLGFPSRHALACLPSRYYIAFCRSAGVVGVLSV